VICLNDKITKYFCDIDIEFIYQENIFDFWMTAKHKILILENFSLFSSGIKSMLENEDLEVLGEVRHWQELFEILKSITPDVILLDLIHYNHSTIESLEKLRNDHPNIPVLLLINEDFANFFRDLILMGITGFVYGDTSLSELIRAIETVATGNEYFPNGILKILRETLQSDRVNLKTLRHQYILTPREVAVCKLFCDGLTYKEIGTTLHISPRTVETHKRNIFAKLKIKSTAELVKYAIFHNLG
jgi:DNA-binding NarL/FixJ family response regulator